MDGLSWAGLGWNGSFSKHQPCVGTNGLQIFFQSDVMVRVGDWELRDDESQVPGLLAYVHNEIFPPIKLLLMYGNPRGFSKQEAF